MDFDTHGHYLDRIFATETVEQLQAIMNELTDMLARDPNTPHAGFLLGACGMQMEGISSSQDLQLAPVSL